MRRIIFALLGACLFFACTEENAPDFTRQKELIPISFDIGFSKEVTTLRSTNELSVKYLRYLVYNANTGVLYKQLIYTDFDGLITDEIPGDDYTFVFIGTNSVLSGFLSNNLFNNLDPPGFLYQSMDVGDTFFKKLNAKVEKGKENNNPIVLDRIVGRIEVILEDAIPEEVTSIGFSVNNYPYEVLFSTTADWRSLFGAYDRTFDISASDRISSGYTYSFFAYENIDKSQNRLPMSITLTAKRTIPDIADPTYLIVAQKTIPGVNVEINKTVRYTGKLFDGIVNPDPNGSPSFSVSLDDTWGETIDKVF